LTRQDFAAASARVVEALRLKPGDPEARAIQGQIARQMEDARVAAAAQTSASTALADRAPVADRAAPAWPGDAGATLSPEASARKKTGATRKDPANDESDLEES